MLRSLAIVFSILIWPEVLLAQPASGQVRGPVLPYASPEGIVEMDQKCQAGAFDLCAELGLRRQFGIGVLTDETKAFEYFEMACEGGSDEGCLALGNSHQFGIGIARNIERALAQYTDLCDHGNMRGCRAKGTVYFNGIDVDRDLAQAQALFQKACDGGNQKACVYVGRVLYTIDPPDYTNAIAIFEAACNDGIASGCSQLAFVYFKRRVLFEDSEKARILAKKACDAEDGYGCFLLGMQRRTFNGDNSYSEEMFNLGCWYGEQKACDQVDVPLDLMEY